MGIDNQRPEVEYWSSEDYCFERITGMRTIEEPGKRLEIIACFLQLRCCQCLYSFPYDEDFPEHFCPYCGMPIQWVRDEEGNWEYVRR